MTRQFTVRFGDLNIEKQSDIVDEIKKELLEQYQEEGKELLIREWNDPRPRTWQEAFVRMYEIDSILWETDEEMVTFDWKCALDDYAEEKATEICDRTYMTWEVEV